MSIYSALDRRAREWGAKAASYNPRRVVYPFQKGVPVASEWNTNRAIKHGLKASAFVFICIGRIMQMVGSVPAVLMKRKGEEWVPDYKDERVLRIEYPNPHQTRREVMSLAAAHLCLGGNSLFAWYGGKPKGRGAPKELWAESPANVEPIPDPIDFISGYKYGPNPADVWDAAEILHIKYLPDPANRYWGMGPLQALAREVDADVGRVNYDYRTVNHPVPEGILVDKAIEDETQLEMVRDAVGKQWNSAGGEALPMVLGGEVTWQALGITPDKMKILENRAFTRDNIALAFGFDPAHFARDKKFDNAKVADKAAWKGAGVPVAEVLFEGFNIAMIPPERRADEYLAPDWSAIPALKEDLGDLLESHEKAIRSYIPPNVSFELHGLRVPPQPGGDKPFIAANLVRPPDEEDDEEREAEKRNPL